MKVCHFSLINALLGAFSTVTQFLCVCFSLLIVIKSCHYREPSKSEKDGELDTRTNTNLLPSSRPSEMCL